MKRFITEYANYKINSLNENDLMLAEFKIDKIAAIEKAVLLVERGIITVNESMRIINEQ